MRGVIVSGAVGAAVLCHAASAWASQISRDADAARAAIAQHNDVQAVLALAPDIQTDDGRPHALKVLQHDKSFAGELLSQIGQLSSSSDEDYEEAVQAIALAEQVGLVSSADGDATLSAMFKNFSTAVLSHKVEANVYAPVNLLAGVDTPAVNAELVSNTLKQMMHRRVSDEGFATLADFVRSRQGSEALGKAVIDALPGISFQRSALTGSVARFDKTFADQRLAKMLRVFPDIQSADGLLALDLKTALASDEDVQFVDQAVDANAVLEIHQLALDVEKMDDDSQTISYQQYEVNLIAAALLMPQNATYQFDYTTGGFRYEYAFDIKLNGSGTAADQVVRDSGQLTWSECKNARIVNVFGGTQPASFMANRDMQDRCASAGPRREQGEVRTEIVRKLADAATALLSEQSTSVDAAGARGGGSAPGVPSKVEFGAQVGDVPGVVASALQRPGLQGAFVGAVDAGSIAERSGLKSGDVITDVDGLPVIGGADFLQKVEAMSPGKLVAIGVLRAARITELKAQF